MVDVASFAPEVCTALSNTIRPRPSVAQYADVLGRFFAGHNGPFSIDIVPPVDPKLAAEFTEQQIAKYRCDAAWTAIIDDFYVFMGQDEQVATLRASMAKAKSRDFRVGTIAEGASRVAGLLLKPEYKKSRSGRALVHSCLGIMDVAKVFVTSHSAEHANLHMFETAMREAAGEQMATDDVLDGILAGVATVTTTNMRLNGWYGDYPFTRSAPEVIGDSAAARRMLATLALTGFEAIVDSDELLQRAVKAVIVDDQSQRLDIDRLEALHIIEEADVDTSPNGRTNNACPAIRFAIESISSLQINSVKVAGGWS